MARILVVDDSAFLRHRCAAILHEMGHEVVEAAGGKQALDAYRTHAPDAALLDAALPGIDGIDALEQIRAFDPAARVAIVTSVSQQEVVIEAIHAGALDFIVKPFEPDRLRSAVTKLLA